MTYSNNKPKVFEAVGNGSSLYHYNIEEVEAEREEQPSKWQYEEVVIWHPLSANKVTEAVIAKRWGNNYEQKLINEFNAAQLGVYDADEAKAKIEAYKSFLSERKALKTQVDNDCAEYGIR